MSMTPRDLDQLKAFVSGKLEEIDESIVVPGGTRLTCIIRSPQFRDGYLIVTDDSLQELSKVIERAILKGADGEVPPPEPRWDA